MMLDFAWIKIFQIPNAQRLYCVSYHSPSSKTKAKYYTSLGAALTNYLTVIIGFEQIGYYVVAINATGLEFEHTDKRESGIDCEWW